jgi:thiol-disulfide isomerase/thioredoxin
MAFAQKSGKQFVITANIAGMKDGVEVKLLNSEHGGEELATAKVKNHAFRLVGKVSSPTLCELDINDVKPAGYKGVLPSQRGCTFFVENTRIKVSAKDFENMPLLFPREENSMKKELNVSVIGGEAQRQYAEYRRYIHEVDLVSETAFADYQNYGEVSRQGMKFDKDSGTIEMVYERDPSKELKYATLLEKRATMLDARNKYNEANQKFVDAHPNYAVSLMVMQSKAEDTFMYTNEEYDHWLAQFKNNYDTTRYAQFAQTVKSARICLKNQKYADFEMITIDSLKTNLSDQLNKTGYTVVDFWASWCGWCRKAIPHIKELYAKYDRTKLDVISISTDDNLRSWYHAKDAEAMPWRQFVLAKDVKKKVNQDYQILGIPDFLLIDPQGRVVFATASPDELDVMIAKLIK